MADLHKNRMVRTGRKKNGRFIKIRTWNYGNVDQT